MPRDRPNRPVKSTQTTFRILETIEERDGARLTELAEQLDLAKSTVHQQLSTLYDLGYVVKEDERYHLGLKFLTLGEHARSRKEVSRLAKPLVADLAEQTGERAQFMVEEHGRAYYVHTEQGEHAVQADRRVGKRRYLHSSAGGKAILAHMPDDAVSDVIDRWGLPPETEHTITDPKVLFTALEEIRERGYSFNEEESINGLHAVGVPLTYSDGTVFGSFSISGPAHRIKGEVFEETLPDLLLGTANELELNTAYL